MTQSALTVISAVSAGPLAALLPVLAGSLAAERQKLRVEQCFSEIVQLLEEQKELVRNLSDEQYKIVNEAALAVFQTTDQKKLRYLRAAVANVLNTEEIKSQDAAVLARVIRDISADEAEYVMRTFHYAGIHLMAENGGAQLLDKILRVDPDSREALIVSGLMSLGLLVPAEPTWDSPNILRFSGIVSKLIVLLRNDDE